MNHSKRVLVLLVLSLILILLGSTLGYYFGNATDNDILEGDDIIILDSSDLGDLGVRSIDVSSISSSKLKSVQTYVFTFEEFSKYTKQTIATKGQLITYLTEANYDISIRFGGDEISANTFRGCAFDQVYGVQLCEFETISYRDVERKITVEISKLEGGQK